MSAFQCCNAHINALVNAAVNPHITNGGQLRVWHDGQGHHLDDIQIGNILTQANDESIMARYGNRGGDEAPVFVRVFNPFAQKMAPVNVLKACNCYAYQACEYDGWEDSLARAIIQTIKEAYIRKLPGYEDAEWEVREAA